MTVGQEPTRSGPPRASTSDLWASVCAALAGEINTAEHSAWVAPLVAASSGDGHVVLAARNAYARDRVRTEYLHRIQRVWTAQDPRGRSVRVETADAAALEPPADEPPAAPCASDLGLDSRFVFDRLVKGAANELATTVAHRHATGRSPFRLAFLHGRTGVGKTHLLQAAAHEAAARGRRVMYLTAETFLTDFLASLRGGPSTGAKFKEQMRAVDLLLVDDVRFIAGKAHTSDEFALTINAVVAGGGRVMCSADLPPEAIEGFDERLRSLFKGGVVCKIEEPDYAMRFEIVRRRAAEFSDLDPGFRLDDAVAARVAAQLAGPGRLVEGCVNKIYAGSALLGREVTDMLVDEAIADVRRSKETKRITVDMIQKRTAAHFDMTTVDLVSACRRRTVVRPRQIAMFLCHRLTDRSLSDIGRRFGGRDHTTVINAIDRVKLLLSEEPRIGQDIEAIERALTH